VADSDLSYSFTCPNCSGTFSILLERIPPVQARFRCPHCKQPMDFPSREEARVYARLQGESAAPPKPNAEPPPPPPPPATPDPPKPAARPAAATTGSTARKSTSAPRETTTDQPPDSARFRVEKNGFEDDEYDRRAIRNLIRTGEVSENDWIRVDLGKPVRAGDLPYLKSLFSLRKTAKVQPPVCCRTHTDKVAFFKCKATSRPLCEDCAQEKKFGGTTIRVCQHCGGTADELVPLTAL